MMITEQLLAYIRDNMKAGFARTDIDVALRAGGWDALDINAAFAAVSAGNVAAPRASAARQPAAAQRGSAQSDIDAEVARIQSELKASHRRQEVPKESGIIGWMLRKKIVTSAAQANGLLIGLTIAFLALSAWIVFK